MAHCVLPVFTALAVVYLLLPIAVMIVFGFNDPQGRFNITWQGFTLDNYATAFQRRELAESLENSFIVAIVSTIVATFLGTLIGAGARPIPVPRPRAAGPAHLPADRHAGDRPRRGAPGDVRLDRHPA